MEMEVWLRSGKVELQVWVSGAWAEMVAERNHFSASQPKLVYLFYGLGAFRTWNINMGILSAILVAP